MALPAASWPPTPNFPPLIQSPPKFWFGEVVRCKESRQKGRVVGVQWLDTGDPSCGDGWYYTIQLLKVDFDNPYFRLRHVGGSWAEESGHEKDFVRVRK